MGKPTGFMEYTREPPETRPVKERLMDWCEVYRPLAVEKLQRQAARCMDCGTPFCHAGCPLGNLIPDWNDLAYRDRWKEAVGRLLATNNFPEFTGRICPAPCEEACVLGINEPPVTIEQIERRVIEHAFEQGWIRPEPPETRTGKRVAVVGSGPAGLACAQQLNRAGHHVIVFERADRLGGLLRYGIPDFKLEKWILDRRLKLLETEGIVFKTNVEVGRDLPVEELKAFDAIVLCGGATRPRDLPVPGRDLEGIHFAMDFLARQNKRVAGDDLEAGGLQAIDAAGQHVIVIGGGDTGSDCVGTANRQGARSVTQFEILPKPPVERPPHQPWPYWPMKLRSSTSHEEGCERHWSLSTKAFLGSAGKVQRVRTVCVEWKTAGGNGRVRPVELEDTEQEWPAERVLLAMGFLGPEPGGLLASLGVQLDSFGNVQTDEHYMTSVPGVFSAGDMRRGQSLVVWAISEGREAARSVDRYLIGSTDLPTKGE
ncbi:MAG TPA: glutamate synthase subunit beta, partial [Firmicutes bacterium]|nr:glutamate synthase subunit beta [Bacillota bacterium]